MSLLDALLLDSYRMNLWVAYRTDGVAGSGTQSDPFDGSSQAKFDALMNAMPIFVSSLTSSGTIATVTAINHGYANGSTVVINGVTGTSAGLFNGSFVITYVDANTFTYTMSSTPSSSPSGTITCRLGTARGPVVGVDVNPPLAIRLGPGTFQTNGYADAIATGGWQPRPGMKIAGSGVDVTILQVAGSSSGTAAHLYAIGHAVSPGGRPNLLDYFEVCDLTIDCNLAGSTGASIASGAVRVMGNHGKIRRIKVIDWGTKITTNPCFVISAVTASDTGWVEDCGIEECIAIGPGSSASGSPITIFHAGGTDSPPAVPQAYGVAPYIRNCFADSGQSFPFSYEFHGLSLGWCKGGIAEGNQLHNVTYGLFQEPTNAQDIIVRNNWFKNVNKGILVGALEPTQTPARQGTLNASGGSASVALSSGSLPAVGDCVLLAAGTTVFNGIVVAVQTVTQSPASFSFNTSATGSNISVTSVLKVFGIGNAAALGNFPAPGALIIEGNVVELATATSGSGIIGIHLDDFWSASSPLQDPTYPTYLFARVLIRDNKIRYFDGVPQTTPPTYVGYGMQLNSAMDLLVRNNVLETIPTPPPPPIQNDRCGSVVYFNNLQPNGTLVPGVNGDNALQYEELSTYTDFALIMGLFNKKS